MKKKLINEKDGIRIGAQHGEVFLQPITKMPEGKTEKYRTFIVGHSESGHNHVLESDVDMEVMPADEKYDLYIRLFEPAKLVHKKSFDIHETQIIVPGDYAVYTKTEYDPFADVIRNIYD